MNLYIVQEYLGVLLLLAVLTVIILVLAVAFVLLQEGTRRAMLWAKTDRRAALPSPGAPNILVEQEPDGKRRMIEDIRTYAAARD
jgi:hypothetical protein